jgi:hypothetical protein
MSMCAVQAPGYPAGSAERIVDMCWMGNNRLVVSTNDHQLTTFIVDDHYHSSSTISAMHHHDNNENDEPTQNNNRNNNNVGNDDNKQATLDEMIRMRMRSSPMIRIESSRLLPVHAQTVAPLPIPSSLLSPSSLSSSPPTTSTKTTTTMTTSSSNKKGKKASSSSSASPLTIPSMSDPVVEPGVDPRYHVVVGDNWVCCHFSFSVPYQPSMCG